MTANTIQNRPTATQTLAFRVPTPRVHMLRAVQEGRGHGDLSETLREAVDLYLDHALLRPGRCPLDDAKEKEEAA